MYKKYIKEYFEIVNNFNMLIKKHDGPVFLFGGHVFSQYLIGFGLNQDKIEMILDNDPNKQGKRLYGTSLFVKSPKILKNVKNAAFILRGGAYNDEIKDDILSNINSDVVFWE